MTKISVVLAALLCLSIVAPAQVTSGTILGVVKDTSGQLVPGAAVNITEPSKGTSSTYRTDDSGGYNAPFLTPGTYTVFVQKEGFKRAISRNITLDVDQKARVDFMLEVGSVEQTLEVVAIAPLVRTESAELGEVVTERSIQSLPLNGRNFAQLVDLVPGVTAGQPGENLSGTSSFNPRAGSDFNALGSQANANAWLVDGIDDNEWTFNTVMVQPSVESIGEFKVLTGSFSAEFGRGAGVVSISTRSGANAYHGEAFEYLRNVFFDARNYFNPTTQIQPAYRRNQFGGAASGRIVKDKLFFFADYYEQLSLKGIVNLNSVPTAAERIGDFSNYYSTSGQLIPIYDPTTTQVVNGQTVRSQFPGNIIPSSRINQVGANIASIYPLPMTSGSFNNFTSAANQVIDDKGGTTRLDYRMGDSDSAFFRYSNEQFNLNGPPSLSSTPTTCCLPTPASAAAKFDLGPYVAGPQVTILTAQGATLNETHLFTPALLNEFRTGFARTNPFTHQSDYGHQSATSLGIQGWNVTQFVTGLPVLTIQDFTGLMGGSAFLPANPRQTNIQFEDNVSWTKGAHQLKFGFRYIRQLASPFTNSTSRGFTFNDNFTGSPQSPSGTGSGIATLLLGNPTAGTRNFLITPYYITNGEWAGFFQDNWKVSPRLSLNLGLRYDVFTPDVEVQNRMVNFSFASLSLIYANQNGTGRSTGIQTRHGDFAPRFGFAYDLTGKGTTIVRGGYGLVYFPVPFSASDELGQNVPWTVSQSFTPDTYPLGPVMSTLPVISNPFPYGVVTVQPTTTAALNAANPAIVSHQLSNLTPYFESWNLDVERQITPSAMLEVAYAGSRGIHITYCYNPNEVEPGVPGVNSASSTASRRLIQPLNNISGWIHCDESNMSNYHALQVKLTERLSHGLTALLSYTFSRSLDYGGSAGSGGGAVGNPQTVTNTKAGYGPSGFDQMHRFVASFTYALPFGKGKQYINSGPVSHIVGGWELDGIATLGTGLPFTVTLNTGVNFSAPSWPNRIASGKLANPGASRWFDTSAFVAPPPNTYGNSARGVLYGPGIINFDLTLLRRFKPIERVTTELRIDAFNAFNTPHFANPVSTIGSPTAGQVTGTVSDNRDLQLSIKLVF